jgi:hypothetical protein
MMTVIIAACAPAISELTSGLRDIEQQVSTADRIGDEIAAANTNTNTTQQAKQGGLLPLEQYWDMLAKVSNKTISRLTGESMRTPHVSLIIWDRNEPLVDIKGPHAKGDSRKQGKLGKPSANTRVTSNNLQGRGKDEAQTEQDQNNVMRVRVFDGSRASGSASQSQSWGSASVSASAAGARISFTLPISLRAGASTGYGLPAGVLAAHSANNRGGNPPIAASVVNAAAVAQSVPVLERALRLGGLHEIIGTTSPMDLIGVDQRALADLVTPMTQSPSSSTAAGVYGNPYYEAEAEAEAEAESKGGSAAAAMMNSPSLSVLISVLCVSVRDTPPGIIAVLRVVYPHEASSNSSTSTSTSTSNSGVQCDAMDSLTSSARFQRSLLRPVVELLASVGGELIAGSLQHLNHRLRQLSVSAFDNVHPPSVPSVAIRGLAAPYTAADDDSELQLQLIHRYREVYRELCRGSMYLLQPPRAEAIESVGTPSKQTAARPMHPASLPPLAATQDTCLKLLDMVSGVLKSDGQAIMLTDNSTVPVSFQVISTGSALQWDSIQAGVFGVVSARSVYASSLVELCVKSGEPVATGDVSTDERYYAGVDGTCAQGSPLLIVPLKGRDESAVGALLVTRSPAPSTSATTSTTTSTTIVFTEEDIQAAELAATYASVSLYWCQGLGSMQRQLSKYAGKLLTLEKEVKELYPARKVTEKK